MATFLRRYGSAGSKPLGQILRSVLGLCAFLCCTGCAKGPIDGLGAGANGRVVATINQSAITLSDVRRAYYRRALSRDGAGGVSPAADELTLQSTVSDLMDRRLLTLAARQHHQAVFTAEVDAAWKQLTYHWEPMALTETLAQLRLSPLAIKEDLRESLLAQKYLRAMVQDRVAVLDLDIERHLSLHPGMMIQPEQVRLRHMVLADDAEVIRVLAKLRQGENFSALAVAHSRASDAAFGGDLGLVDRQGLPSSLAQMVFALTPHKVSQPITLCDGIHLFFVSEKRAKRAISVAQARPRAEAVLRQEGEKTALATHLAQLKQAATIVTHEVTLEDIL